MSLFSSVGALRPRRHFFDLSYEKKLTADMGLLYPVVYEEVYPGDKFKLGNEFVVRMQPLVAPVLTSISARTEYFFVPYRLLWDDWTNFITGGKDGNFSGQIPLWVEPEDGSDTVSLSGVNDVGITIWDYMDLPVFEDTGDPLLTMKAVDVPNALPKRAYNLIWNDYYRDEDLQDEVDLDQNYLLRRAWKKDYFTSARLSPQRGTAPAVPITGILPISGGNPSIIFGNSAGELGTELVSSGSHGMFKKWYDDGDGNTGYFTVGANSVTNAANAPSYYSMQDKVKGHKVLFAERDPKSDYAVSGRELEADISNTYVNLEESAGIGFTASQVRLLMQTQKWMERNMRAGVRYNEFLMAHFGFSPSDSTLQRPYFIGGNRSSLLVSEVLQTSQTTDDSPLGTLGGRGIGVSGSKVGTFVVSEPGIIIGLFSIIPKLTYGSQGINKKFSRKSRFDFYSPEFAHLSEQPIYKKELLYSAPTANQIFGYAGIYDELRHNRDSVNGYFRQNRSIDLSYWHLGRFFDYAPSLNSSFISCDPSKRIFQFPDEPGFLVNFGNIIKSIRPISVIAEPGLIDHF